MENSDSEVVMCLRGKGGKTNTFKLLGLTSDEAFTLTTQLKTLNERILATCLESAAELSEASKSSYSDSDRLQIALALFDKLGISSFTYLRSMLEKDLHER